MHQADQNNPQDIDINESDKLRIQARVLKDQERMSFLPRLFGNYMMQGESYVFAWMQQLCPAYQGGFWDFVSLDNGGGFMMTHRAVAQSRSRKYVREHGGKKQVLVVVDSNGYEGWMSAEAAGIVATMFALSDLMMRASDPVTHMLREKDEFLAERYYQLRAFAAQHEEIEEIFGAID